MIYIRRDTDSVLVRIEICHLAAFFRIEICRLAAFFNRRSIASHKKAARRQISIQTHACAHPMKKKQRDGRFKSRLEPALAQWKKAARRQISIQIRTFARPMKKNSETADFNTDLRVRSTNEKSSATADFNSDSRVRSPNEKKQRDGRFQSRLVRSLAQWKKAARRQISIWTITTCTDRWTDGRTQPITIPLGQNGRGVTKIEKKWKHSIPSFYLNKLIYILNMSVINDNMVQNWLCLVKKYICHWTSSEAKDNGVLRCNTM